MSAIKKISKNNFILAGVLILFALVILFSVEVLESFGRKTTSLPFFSYHEDVIDLIKPLSLPKVKEISFSHEDHFYEDSIYLVFQANDGEIIDFFYTLDGSPPDGVGGILYIEPLLLSDDSDEVKSHIIKVCGRRADGTYTDIYTHTYFIGSKVFERFDTLVFSLSTDPYNLYDYEYGILIPGKLRDEYISETGDMNPHEISPANFHIRGRESERPVYVELINYDGQKILSQNAGMRVFGGLSRIMSQKSLQLFARRQYDENNRTFKYDFFPDNRTYTGRSITDYNRIVLRNNSNDSTFAFLRDEVVMDLAAGVLPDTQSSRASAVFLNGEYYGFAWVRQVYNDKYFDDHNEISEREGLWAILKGFETADGRTGWVIDRNNPFEVDAAEDYTFMHDLMKPNVYFDDDSFKVFNDLADIENYLTYHAVQIYVDNSDWSYNNFSAYRYFGEDAHYLHDGLSTADGKWRWLIYDTDFAFKLYDNSPTATTLGRILGQENFYAESGVSWLFSAVIYTGKDQRANFITIMCDLMNWHFSPEKIENVVRRKQAERANELYHNYKYGGFQLTKEAIKMHDHSDILTFEFAEAQIEKIISFARQRPAEMRKQIEEYLFTDPSGYIITCSPHEFSEIKLNTINITSDFEGFYYDVCTVKLSASKADGYNFSHWLVNGIEVADEELLIGKDDAIEGLINIELVLVPEENIVPVVTLIDHERQNDYIVIHNPHSESIDLSRYYISDDPEKPFKQVIAYTMLRPGQSLKLFARNYIKPDALGGFGLSFNLSNGETLTITGVEGETVFEFILPRIHNDYVLIRDSKTGRYVDVKRESLTPPSP